MKSLSNAVLQVLASSDLLLDVFIYAGTMSTPEAVIFPNM